MPASQHVYTRSRVKSGTAEVLYTKSYFDGLGREYLNEASGPEGRIVLSQTEYNEMRKVKRKSMPYFQGGQPSAWISYEYDPLGRVIKTTQPDGTYTRAEYMKDRVRFYDALNHKRLHVKDGFGRLDKVYEYKGTGAEQDPYGSYATTDYTFDRLGNLVRVLDAKQNETTIQYNLLGQKVSMNDPDMHDWSYRYDTNGNLTYQQDARGKIIVFTYNQLNQIEKKFYLEEGQDPRGLLNSFFEAELDTEGNLLLNSGGPVQSLRLPTPMTIRAGRTAREDLPVWKVTTSGAPSTTIGRGAPPPSSEP